MAFEIVEKMYHTRNSIVHEGPLHYGDAGHILPYVGAPGSGGIIG